MWRNWLRPLGHGGPKNDLAILPRSTLVMLPQMKLHGLRRTWLEAQSAMRRIEQLGLRRVGWQLERREERLPEELQSRLISRPSLLISDFLNVSPTLLFDEPPGLLREVVGEAKLAATEEFHSGLSGLLMARNAPLVTRRPTCRCQ